MMNPMCNCGADIEITVLYNWLYSLQQVEVLNTVYKLDSALQNSSENQLLMVLLHFTEKFALSVNKETIRLTINFLKASECFDEPLFYQQYFH